MGAALLILFPLAFFHTYNLRSNRYRPILHVLFWIFVFNFLFLLWVGARPISQPFIILGQISTLIYFSYFIILMILGCTYFILASVLLNSLGFYLRDHLDMGRCSFIKVGTLVFFYFIIQFNYFFSTLFI